MMFHDLVFGGFFPITSIRMYEVVNHLVNPKNQSTSQNLEGYNHQPPVSPGDQIEKTHDEAGETAHEAGLTALKVETFERTRSKGVMKQGKSMEIPEGNGGFNICVSGINQL